MNTKLTLITHTQTQMDNKLTLMKGDIQSLINYNSNRDKELELLIENVLFQYLISLGWKVTIFPSRIIYNTSGSKIIELDGAMTAFHKSLKYRLFFIIETKQLFTMKNFNEDFLKKIEKLKAFIYEINSDPTIVSQSEDYKR